MGLRTVQVPPELEPAFAVAEELVSRLFAARRDDPARGTIEILGERYVLVRAASLSVEFFQLVDDLYGPGRGDEASAFARNLLFDLAHALGRADAKSFAARTGETDPIAQLAAGPVHFAYTGWASVDISSGGLPQPDGDFHLVYDHPYSFESDAGLRAGKSRAFPVCIMNAGYSSGWSEQCFGINLVASEIACRARGDETCRFVMAHPARIDAHVARYLTSRPHLARGYQIPDFFGRQRLEDELRRGIAARTEELVAANAALRHEMQERAKVERQLRQAHKLEAVALLAGGLAHDFNNLIAVILTRTQLLDRRFADDDPVRGELAEIRRASERAAALTRKLLAFGQVQVVDRQPLDVNRVLSDLADVLIPLIGEDVVLAQRLAAPPPIVHADHGQLEQLVMNLVLNARDAMPRGGRLEIATDAVDLAAPVAVTTGELAAGRYGRIAVTDEGVGMDDDTIGRIFDPFFTTKPEGQGTGLGLSTVYGIVQQSGGGIAVTSAPGRGTTFSVYLPVARGAPPAVAATAPSPSTGGRESILVCEDQLDLGRAIRDTLEDFGYRVHLVDTAAAALALARSGVTFDAVVTDVVMPHMTGAELAQQLAEVRPGVPVLFVSGYTRDVALRRGILDRSAAFLAKPFSPDQLGRRLRALLDAAKPTDPAPSP